MRRRAAATRFAGAPARRAYSRMVASQSGTISLNVEISFPGLSASRNRDGAALALAIDSASPPRSRFTKLPKVPRC
jgi:hypothetical protein